MQRRPLWCIYILQAIDGTKSAATFGYYWFAVDFNSCLEVKVLIRTMNIQSPNELSFKLLSSSRAPKALQVSSMTSSVISEAGGKPKHYFCCFFVFVIFPCLLAICTVAKAWKMLLLPAYMASVPLRPSTESKRNKTAQLSAVKSVSTAVTASCILDPFHLSQMHPASESFLSPSLDILLHSP